MNEFLNYPLPVNLLDIDKFEVSMKVIVALLLGVLALSLIMLSISVPSTLEPLISPVP